MFGRLNGGNLLLYKSFSVFYQLLLLQENHPNCTISLYDINIKYSNEDPKIL